MTTGIKHDQNKPRPTLVVKSMARALNAVIEIAERGADKYSEDNWLDLPDGFRRYTDAMLRHVMAEMEEDGQHTDADSGLLHAAHAAWNALARLELLLRITQCEPSFPLRAGKYKPSWRHLYGDTE